MNNQLLLFQPTVCKECELFKPTLSNYGKCLKKKVGSVDRYVYENSRPCEIDRRIFNNKMLNKVINNKMKYSEMIKNWKRE
jgi:hypothetical protein